MKHFLSHIVFSLTAFTCIGQALVTNNGQDIFIKSGALVIIKTNSLHNALGTVDNGGQFIIEGNVLNNANLNGSATAPTGFYRVLGDWINNANVNSYQDSVELYGNAQQITGTNATTFYNLILSGNTAAIKTQTVDAYVAGFLNLNDVELATQNKNMVVLNTANTAILVSKVAPDYGFVSSLDTGKLIRHTNTATPYYYPLGTPTSTGSPFYYRPIDVRPTAASANAYGARLAKDPTAEGYNVNTLDDILCKVNPLFYHQINHPEGTDAGDLKFYFRAASDNRWTDVGHWSTSRWNYTSAPSASTIPSFDALEIRNWNNFNPQPFALASKKFTVDAGPDQEIAPGQTVSLTPVISTSSVNSYNWTPNSNLDFSTIRNPNASPTETTRYTLLVTDNLGCMVKDSLLIKIKDDELLIPTAFSPNGDGENDVFRVLNKNIDQFKMLVFNRWGEKVFESDNPNDGWDGSFRDVKQDIGVFVWNVVYKINGSPKAKSKSGNVTLVR